ncbi:MAG: DnaJ C-terminal domain-containing protein [Verrucomicrobiales bacterium]|nr:DnaJ C-terminal domain-containing protein [Verrucomicrobiales bacterium]
MAVHFRDYYEVLGISRDADPSSIKKAFKKLARKYHPDVAEDKETAEEKFKEINEAYEVLSDPEKRSKYDRLGKDWEHGSDFTPPPGWGGFGSDAGGNQYEYHFDGTTGFSDFFENLFGGRSAGDPFGAFGGGHPGAKGSMSVRGQDIESDLLVSLPEVIHGGERVIRLQGRDDRKVQTIKVKIPKGVTENQLIRCGGLGGEGYNGGESGDLYLRVRYERHPDYRFVGSDIYEDMEIYPWECILGISREVKTPHGKVRIKIAPDTQPGSQLRIRSQGLPKNDGTIGDLYLVIKMKLPTTVSSEEQEHWEALANLAEKK